MKVNKLIKKEEEGRDTESLWVYGFMRDGSTDAVYVLPRYVFPGHPTSARNTTCSNFAGVGPNFYRTRMGQVASGSTS